LRIIEQIVVPMLYFHGNHKIYTSHG